MHVRERERETFCLNCVCFTELVVWINPLIAVSLKTRLPEGYCKCMCERERERDFLFKLCVFHRVGGLD